MLFENLRIKRIVVHEVFKRKVDKSINPPLFAGALEVLSPEAMGAFRLRVTEALSGQSQSLHMKIIKHGPGSFMDIAESLLEMKDAAFLSKSQDIANKLAEEQRALNIPGGMLIVFDGTVGVPGVPLLGAIKAETQAGFRRSKDGDKSIVEFLQNIFLTPATRLYKIGIFIFDDKTKSKPDGRRAFVFDSNISLSNREAAASYFYEGFLGCALPSDGPYETAKFFELTKEFVRRSDLDQDKKRSITDGLYAFIRDDQEPTFTVDQFSERFLPPDNRDDYLEFMRGRKFTPNAVVRDISQMGNKLHRRRFKFGSDIELSVSPEALATKVKIEAIKSDDQDNPHKTWTRIIIQDSLVGEQ